MVCYINIMACYINIMAYYINFMACYINIMAYYINIMAYYINIMAYYINIMALTLMLNIRSLCSTFSKQYKIVLLNYINSTILYRLENEEYWEQNIDVLLSTSI